jgi:hypothetical protein
VVSSALPDGALELLYTRLHSSLLAQVGSASLLTSLPAQPVVRVVVIDSAPDAAAGQIQPGLSRHGDTLAHLIEDIVCVPTGPSDRKCAAEVTTVLALPWEDRHTLGAHGGVMGSPAELAHAIYRAVAQWQRDRDRSSYTPPRLVLNLSLGWEHTPKIADCSEDVSNPPADAVRAALQYAASLGAVIVAAAGNDSGGRNPRTGLVCPARYQSVHQDDDPTQALLTAASGVDYADHPLQTARPGGITGIAALGLGGIAWSLGDVVPSPFTGSSVSTAVVSAVSALVWAAQPNWSPADVTLAVYSGGSPVGPANACPLLLGSCESHRVSVCGALIAAGAAPSCSVPPPMPWSCPDLHAEVGALEQALTAVVPTNVSTAVAAPVARFVVPTIQVTPWVFPAPVAVTCRACVFAPNEITIELESGQWLGTPALVLQQVSGTSLTVPLGNHALVGPNLYVFSLPSSYVALSQVQSAYLTGFNSTESASFSEQILVQQY